MSAAQPAGKAGRPAIDRVLASAALGLRSLALRSGRAIEARALTLRALPIPVIGRIEAGRLLLDLRCLGDEAAFLDQIGAVPAARGYRGRDNGTSDSGSNRSEPKT